MSRIVATVVILLTSSVAAAAQDFPEGVYLASPEHCDAARKSGIESVFEQGELMLTTRGLDGYEYSCEFVGITKAKVSTGWLVTALCEEPGYAFPEMIAIMPRGEGELELTSMAGDGEGGNDGLYVLCEGVSPP
jgi:hypothetical protein